MFTRDVICFAIIFAVLLYVPFATGLRKMYSYYVTANTKNATQPLARLVYNNDGHMMYDIGVGPLFRDWSFIMREGTTKMGC
jgi:hypothetical protein